MNWPDDYIPEGFTPYHIEDAGIIFNCDCRDILPHLPKVDLVLRNSLQNSTISDTVSSKNRGYCDGQRKAAGRNQTEDGSGEIIMGVSPGRNNMALSQAKLVSGDDCGILPSITNGLEQGIKTVVHQISEQGEKGEFKRQIQRWLNKHPLQIDDSERQMLEMFCNGTTCCASQEWESSGQQIGKPSSALRQLPQQTAQKTLVEENEITIITDPPYPDFNKEHGKEWDYVDIGIFDPMPFRQFIFWPANRFFSLDCTAYHIWHKPNGQSNEHFELIYERNGKKVCRVFRVPIINYKTLPEWTPHPTQKPLKLIKSLISLTNTDIILDPFLGSGTTAVAAKELGRKFIGIEISEEYCRIAVKRLRQGVLDFG